MPRPALKPVPKPSPTPAKPSAAKAVRRPVASTVTKTIAQTAAPLAPKPARKMRLPPSGPSFVNRELSLLQFNERVLAMAEATSTPLLERLRYVCIVGSNLDEFFEIRVSSLKEQHRLHPTLRGPDGLTAAQALSQVQQQVHDLVKRLYALLNEHLLPSLRAEGIYVHHASEWDDQQRAWAHELFVTEMMPLLTPIALDPAHPFPRVLN